MSNPIMSNMTERLPSGHAWTLVGRTPPGAGAGSIWQNGLIRVVSSLDQALLPDGSGDVGPQWHISVTTKGKRPKPRHLAAALRDFRMTEAEEDNHHPGAARHFFLVVDPARRVDCECKATEETIVEPDGYRWTNPTPTSGEGCRGCEWALAPMGKPCPIHAAIIGGGA